MLGLHDRQRNAYLVESCQLAYGQRTQLAKLLPRKRIPCAVDWGAINCLMSSNNANAVAPNSAFPASS